MIHLSPANKIFMHFFSRPPLPQDWPSEATDQFSKQMKIFIKLLWRSGLGCFNVSMIAIFFMGVSMRTMKSGMFTNLIL
jgi:hypothetical protein